MRKQIARYLWGTVFALALVAGCGSNSDMQTMPDMSAAACTGLIPQASNDIINACTVDTRETVMIMPAFPSNYPQGMPPALIPPP